MSENPRHGWPIQRCRIVVEDGDLCELAFRERGEDRQHAVLLKITRLIQASEASKPK